MPAARFPVDASVPAREPHASRPGRAPDVHQRAIRGRAAPASVERQQRDPRYRVPCAGPLAVSVVARRTRYCFRPAARIEVARGEARTYTRRAGLAGGAPPPRGAVSGLLPTRGGVMSELLLDAAGRRRSPATLPEFHAGRPPRNKGIRYPAD